MPTTERRPGVAVAICLYTLARLLVVAVVAGLLALAGVPLLVAVLVGLIVALPLSMVLFRGLRGQLDQALSAARERRSAERALLRSRLRGEADAGDPAPVSEQPPAGQDAQSQAERGQG